MTSLGRILVETQKAVTRAHRAVLRSPLGRLGGPFLILTTTGRRSGRPRETVLSFFQDGANFVVIASNGGAVRHPDWYRNLERDPRATVVIGGREVAVVAKTVSGGDRERLWRRAVLTYPGYAGYQARARRQIPVVRLVPV